MPVFESPTQRRERKEKEALAEHNPWDFNTEDKTINRIRELQLQIIESQEKRDGELSSRGWLPDLPEVAKMYYAF